MRKLYLIAITLGIIVNLSIVSCKEQSYKAIPEYIEIINNSDYTLNIKYDSTYFYIPYDYEYSEHNRFDSIPPGEQAGTFITYNNYNLIMPDSMFSRLISTIRIFRTNAGDTIYVNPHKYNQRSVWESTAGVFIFEGWEEQATERLSVTNMMFNDL